MFFGQSPNEGWGTVHYEGGRGQFSLGGFLIHMLPLIMKILLDGWTLV